MTADFLAMAGKMGRETGARNGFRSIPGNTDNFDFLGAAQQRHRIPDGPRGSAASVPGDNDLLEPRAFFPIGRDDDHRPARGEEHRFDHGPVQGEIIPRTERGS